MKSVDEMIEINRNQATYYDHIHAAEADTGSGGYSKHEGANPFTKMWAALRYRQYRALGDSAVAKRKSDFHRNWIEKTAGGRTLEIGCFSGSAYTFDLAKAAERYEGIELSKEATAALNRKLENAGLAEKAQAICGDFLDYEFPAGSYDAIYTHGVLHHFENPDPLFQKISSLLRKDGHLIFVEPVAINPVFRTIRAAYRPLQSDAAWEWPFRQVTVDSLQRHFEMVDGFGWGRNSALLSTMVGLPIVGGGLHKAYNRLIDQEIAAGIGKGYWLNSMVVGSARKRG